MDLIERVSALIEPAMNDMGFELVRVRLIGSQRKTLEITADPLDGGAMTVDHCADISRAVSAILDVDDPIPEAYVLEVGSPGIDRPLTKIPHFERFAGFDAKVELHRMLNGRKRFNGKLLGVEDGDIRLDQDGEVLSLPFADIRAAKLILTDELLAAAQAGIPAQAGAAEGGAVEGGWVEIDDPAGR